MKARKEVLETWESLTAAVLQHQRINASISTHDQVSLKGGYTTAFPIKRLHDCNDHWSCAKRASKPAERDGPLSIRSIIRLAKPTHYQVITLASILLFFFHRLTFVGMRTARSPWLWISLTQKQANQPHGKFELYLARHGWSTSTTVILGKAESCSGPHRQYHFSYMLSFVFVLFRSLCASVCANG